MTYGLKEAHDELLSELKELQDENARLRSCLSYDEECAREIIGEYNELREKYAEVCETSAMLRADMAAARERQAKLRELVREMYDELVSCEEKEIICGGHKFDKDVRELGIEVER